MIVNYSNDNQLMITFNNQAEQVLLQQGYDNMSADDKNSLVALIAYKQNKVFSDITLDSILSYHKQLKLTSLGLACENAITSGFTATNGHTYRLNQTDQLNILGQREKLRDDSTITTVNWLAVDVGDWIAHTVSDWLTYVYSGGFNWVDTQRSHYRDLKKNVLAATTHSALVAITW